MKRNNETIKSAGATSTAQRRGSPVKLIFRNTLL